MQEQEFSSKTGFSSSETDTDQQISSSIHDPSSIAQCPVAHAPDQPLPPGHPPTPFASASTLKPPTGAKCVFFRTYEDLSQTPPISRAASIQMDDFKRFPVSSTTLNSHGTVDPNTTFVLASRNSQLALIQTLHVSAMLNSHFGKYSPAFSSLLQDVDGSEKEKDASSSSSSSNTPPLSPLPVYEDNLVNSFNQKAKEIGIESPISFPYTSMSTGGDQNNTSPLYVIGGEGRAIWTKELEVALAEGAVDAIVHCLKDVPTTLPEGMMLATVLEREDPRDALVIKDGLPYKTLDELPPGSVIGTSSIRRVAQLRRRYPDLVFSDVRGNLITRLAKLDSAKGPYTALVLAAAGLIRLKMGSRITAFLSAPVMMHAVGQGSLTIEVRKPPPGSTPLNNRDARLLAMVRSIGCWRSTFRQEAERSLLHQLEGGCSIPVGVESRFDDHDVVEGERNEREAVRQVDRDNGHLEDNLEPVKQNGHIIPASQIAKHSSPSSRRDLDDKQKGSLQPPPLKRLATEKDVQDAKIEQMKTDSHSNQIPSTSSNVRAMEVLLPEDRTLQPNKDHYLTLNAAVVSLDGSRHCEYSLRQKVQTVEDARQLGIDVANELAHKRGAKEILEEVERHRRLAEEADDRRRKAEKERRNRNGDLSSTLKPDLDSNKNNESNTSMSEEERESRRKLEEILQRSIEASSPKLQKLPLPSSLTNEIDRRGIPRDDGQPKAWEV